MKKVLTVAFLVVSLLKINAQGFSGSIEFKYYNLKDTNSNVYYVKDKMVKLEQYVKKTTVTEGSFIFDLKTNSIKAVHHKRKVWSDHKSETPPIIKGVCEVIKGSNSKTMSGYKCKEYIVKNPSENTSITYWIAEGKFNFFVPMMKLWNRKDRQSIYFNQISNLPEGSMPLYSEEKQISDGKTITKLEVTKINKKAPENSAFEIPATYNKFE
ncbi:MAG TPA: DUF4412 domain-containing protein [Bacteroidia bacterium]|nr:DUF4412 domain-containing protein [Bacteroidia bacterium]